MRTVKAWLGALASLSLLFSGAAFAAESGQNGSEEMGAQSANAGKVVHGKITQLLKSDHEILLSDHATPLVVSQDAKIWRDGKSVSFGDLKPGDEVRASFDVDGAKVISIQAESKMKKGENGSPGGEKTGY